MAYYEKYNPDKHSDQQLFEMQAEGDEDLIKTVWILSKVSHDIAAQTPWFYAVKVEDDDAADDFKPAKEVVGANWDVPDDWSGAD